MSCASIFRGRRDIDPLLRVIVSVKERIIVTDLLRHRRTFLLAAFSLLLVTALPGPIGRAHAHSLSRAVARTASHGLRLTLTVPRRRYPRNALIRVTLQVTNVSRHAISIESGQNFPRSYVLDSSGNAGYDPLSPLGAESLSGPTGPGPRYEVINRGKTITSPDYVVLRGNEISARVFLGKLGAPSGPMITMPPVAVTLRDEPAPVVHVSTSPSLQAVVTPARPMSGSMFYLDQTACATTAGTYETGEGWVARKTAVVTPIFRDASSDPSSCAGTRTWHALVGWLNHPVTYLSYQDPPSTKR
jgi:hypothetical protein